MAPSTPSKLPTIGITGRHTLPGEPFPLLPAVAIQTTFVAAVERAGGLGCILRSRPIDEAEADAIVTSLDGIVLTGGIDVDPQLYGQEPHPALSSLDRIQDDYEIELVRAAIRNETPVLCICRGHQILNVAYGGTLDQHITGKAGIGKHGVPLGGGGHLNDVAIDPSSRLFRTIGAAQTHGECHHHQAVDRVGDGLRVVARTADGVVEGLEPIDEAGWILSVQWHPEDTAATDAQQQVLFDALVEATRGSNNDE